MNKFYFLLLPFILLMLLSSCSEDSDDSSNKEIEQINNEKKEMNKLIGYWNRQDGKEGDFLFFEDGNCRIENALDNRLNTQNRTSTFASGKWNYSTETGILATDIKNWQWQVTLISEDSWSGVTLDNQTKTSMSFRRVNNKASYLNQLLQKSSWSDNNGNVIQIKNISDGYIRMITSKSSSFYDKIFLFKETNESKKFVVNYVNSSGTILGSVIITNPFNPSKCIINFEGQTTGTLTFIKFED